MDNLFELGRLKKYTPTKYISQPSSPFYFNINRCKLTRKKNTSTGVYVHHLGNDILYLLEVIEQTVKRELVKHAPVWFSNINSMDVEHFLKPILNKEKLISTHLSKSAQFNGYAHWYFVHIQVLGVIITSKSFEILLNIKNTQEIFEELPWETKLLLTNFEHNQINQDVSEEIENEITKMNEANEKIEINEENNTNKKNVSKESQESVLQEFVIEIPLLPISEQENVLKLRSRSEILKERKEKIST